jgi:hypothetical protein
LTCLDRVKRTLGAVKREIGPRPSIAGFLYPGYTARWDVEKKFGVSLSVTPQKLFSTLYLNKP